MNSSSVMISGWLRKSPPEKKLRRNAWRKRWFVLRSGKLSGNPNLLEYYKHEGSKKPIGAICLSECSQIDANVPVKYERKDPSQQFVFDIVTKARTYFLVAQSSHEMSFWVRYLCDLCGFNHDNPENQQDLGSQQQTFRASQPVPRGGFPNGTSSLLDNEQATPSDAPQPLPRPERTMTHRSVMIKNRGTNGQVSHQDPTGSTSTESNQASTSGTPGSLRRDDSKHKNGYSYADEAPIDQPPLFKPEPNVDSEYLYLTDCKTAPKPPESNALLAAASNNMGDRRSSSTDSVFTHEGATSDTGSEVIVEQPPHPAPLRFGGTSLRKQRLDSMPDCPPPPPPVKAHTGRPLINMIDERGYTYPPDDVTDGDIIMEARKRSVPTSGGLSPIDDTELHRVPLNLQRDCGVDEMGIRILEASTSASSSRFATYNTSSGYGTEYINTADASAEAGFGSFAPMQLRQDAPQQFPIVGAPFATPNSVFGSPGLGPEWGSRPQHYDTPSPLANLYASPRTASPHHIPLSHKGSLYSSTNTLSPFGPRGSPMRVSTPQASPAHVPRMRRSSSVGQLENVANDLATQTTHDSPSRVRRSSIDHRGSGYSSPAHAVLAYPHQYGAPVPMDQFGADPSNKTSIPPPRPPKSDQTAPDRFKTYPNPEMTDSSNYFNLSVCYTEGLPKSDVPPSPPHTEVFSVGPDWGPPSSPQHTTIVNTFLVEDDKKNDKNGGRSGSSSSGVSTSDSSSGRSSAAAVYDVAATLLRDPPVVSMYDTPKKMAENLHINDIYDSPKSAPQPSLYDTPNNKPAQLPDIDEARSDYEPMLNQLSPIGDEVQSYTCMGGATSLVNSPPFTTKPPLSPSAQRSTAVSEPPPVKRDLKPKQGRASLGSDGGGTETSKHLSRSSYDDTPHFDQGGRSAEPPLSPPHAILMHTMASTSVVGSPSVDSFPSMRAPDRLQPPERPPKTPSQSGLSPRTPPSAMNVLVPDRHIPYNFDRARYPQDGAVGHPISKPKSGGLPYVPGRPPKPISMKHGASPIPIEGAFPSRHTRELGRSQKSFSNAGGNIFPPYGAGIFHPMSAIVPPPPMDAAEKKLTYVELGQFDSPFGGMSESAPSAEKGPKGEAGVEYWVLDPEKTEALQKMKVEREKEQLKRGSFESRSIKGGKT